MDRLISEQELLKHFDPREDWVVVQTIKAIPSVEPYKGMTNGQVHDMLYQMLVELKDGADRYGAEYWWNKPYEPQERSE